MAFIEGGDGTVNEADISRLKDEMIIDEHKSWRDNVANFRSIFTLFATVGLFTTDLDKRYVLDKVIAKTKFASILEGYKDDYPDARHARKDVRPDVQLHRDPRVADQRIRSRLRG